MRIKLIKDYDNHKKGEVINLKKEDAFWVVETGYGIHTKDLTANEIRTK